MTLIPAVDISQWQVTTPDPAGRGLVICRAAYNTGYDTRYASHAADVRRNGDYLGAYGFGVPGDGAAQAKALLNMAPDVDQMQLASGKWVDLYALDLEPEHGVEMTNAQAKAFIAAMHSKGKTVGLYHSASGYPELGQDWRWVADWRGSEPTLPWDIWQFTNKAEDGTPLDRDYCRRQLRRKENKIVASLTPAAEPLVYTGVIASVLVGTGLATTGEAASLAPGIAAILTAIPTLLMLIGRQFVTPNGNVPTPTYVTPSVPAAPVTPAAPVVVPEPVYSVTVVEVIDETAFLADVKGGTPCWKADGSPHAAVEADGSVVSIARKVKLSGSLNGTFYQSAQTPPLYYRWQDATAHAAVSAPPVADAAPAPAEPAPIVMPTSNPPVPDANQAQAVAQALGALDAATQAYWMTHSGTVVDTYEPAVLLARWLQREQQGIAGTALTQADLTIGLAYARARASLAGVTAAQLAAAQAGLALETSGKIPVGTFGAVQGPDVPTIIAELAVNGGKPWTNAQIEWSNAHGGAIPPSGI